MTKVQSLRVATRGSALALWQTRHVSSMLNIEVQEVVMKTSGEARLDVPIHALGGQGAFVKELQYAVLEGRADFAVHSAKDLPAITPEGLTIACVPLRGDVRDALVGNRLEDVPQGGAIGTGSVRRAAQLAAMRPDLSFGNLRGNIDTRLSKAKDFDAIVVAAAALQRLGYEDKIAQMLSVDEVLPQVGQGALAIECRSDDVERIELLKAIEDRDSRLAVDAERSFLAELGGACNYPEGAYATVEDGVITLTGLISSGDGQTVLRYQEQGNDPQALGRAVARYLLDEAGGKQILDALNTARI